MGIQTNKPKFKDNPEFYASRNAELLEDRKSGMSWRELIKKYDLSETRIRKILDRFSNKFKGTK